MIQRQIRERITKWYEYALEDYGIHGRYERCEISRDSLTIYHEEEGKHYKCHIPFYWDYSPEQIYNIWMEGWDEA